MLVASLGWPLLMALTVSVYWLTPPRWRMLALAAITAAFLLSISPVSLALLAAFTVLTYCAARPARTEQTPGGVRVALITALIGATLVSYKLDAQAAHEADGMLDAFVIPLGLSYYAFRCIHYAVERYRGALAPHGFGDFCAYLFFLPTLIAGPIHRFGAFHEDLKSLRWDGFDLAEGLERILYGYVKIVVIAGFAITGQLGEWIADAAPGYPWLAAYLQMLQFGFNLYFLFAGYSDVAIGFALLLGFRVMENFHWPFASRNISEFWRRWHISLSSWCRDCVFHVVVAHTRRPALAAVSAMLVLGLWHEISARYLCWGLMHGLGIVAWQQFQKLKARLPVPAIPGLAPLAAGLLTFHFVMFSFVLLSEPQVGDALAVWRVLLGL